MSWLDDPRLARRFARVHWIVLVAVFVVITRFDFGATGETLILGAMLSAVCFLNAPVIVGLYKSRAESGTRAYRVVALALVMRVIATGFVLWIASPR
jgi:hypothetical protein